ncbi:MAG: HPr family phosphocarrier protein [Desulfurococcaceae archaeon]
MLDLKAIEVKLLNKSGLHARPAVRFVQLASKFKSTIEVCKHEKCVNAKNILQILSLGVDFGDVIMLKVNGDDEDQAYNELLNLLIKVLPEEDK